MLKPEYTPQFKRDYKRLTNKHIDTRPLKKVVDLVLENSRESKDLLIQRHNMHTLKGEWRGSLECHVANAGDWLIVWKTGNGIAVLQRTGSHDDIFR